MMNIPMMSERVKWVPTQKNEKTLAAMGSMQAMMEALTGPILPTQVRKAVKEKTVPTSTKPPKVSAESMVMVGS